MKMTKYFHIWALMELEFREFQLQLKLLTMKMELFGQKVSPFDIVLINLISNNESTVSFCEDLYSKLKEKNYDVLLDDRAERPGIKFSDADLIGIPIQIIVGKNFVDSKKIGVKKRKNLNEDTVSSDNIIEFLKQMDV